MTSDQDELLSVADDKISPLSLVDLLPYLKKRLHFLENLDNQTYLATTKGMTFTKLIEYTERFSLSSSEIHNIENDCFNQLMKYIKIQDINLLKAKIFFCKMRDLTPNNVEEAIILLPGIEKIFDFKDLKYLINKLFY